MRTPRVNTAAAPPPCYGQGKRISTSHRECLAKPVLGAGAKAGVMSVTTQPHLPSYCRAPRPGWDSKVSC